MTGRRLKLSPSGHDCVLERRVAGTQNGTSRGTREGHRFVREMPSIFMMWVGGPPALSRGLACELPPVEEDHRFAGGQVLGYLTDRCQGGRWQPVEQVIGDGFQCQSATYDLAVGCLNDLGGFPDCLVPDSGVGVGEGSFGGVEPGGD